MTFLVYVFPACIDLMVGSFFFVGTVRLAESGADAVAVSAVLTVWGLCYMLSSLLSGRVAGRRTYVPLALASCAAMSAAALAFIVVPSLSAIFVIIAFFGVAVAFFFPPYMIFMKDFTAGRARGLLVSTATYTFAWSLGLGAGPFIAGFLWSAAGWQWVFVLDAALALFAGAGTFLLSRGLSVAAPAGAPQPGEGADRPDMAWVGWVTCGVLLMALSGVRGLFPSTAVLRNVSKQDQGIVLALICLGQAVVSLVIRGHARWMYAVAPGALLGGTGVIALALFAGAGSAPVFMAGAFLLGLCSGLCFNYMTFHSLVHPSRAGRYIGINESVVGLTGIVGPLIGAGVARAAGHPGAYILLAALCALAFTAQALIHARLSRRAVSA
jgi:MFS family permease